MIRTGKQRTAAALFLSLLLFVLSACGTPAPFPTESAAPSLPPAAEQTPTPDPTPTPEATSAPAYIVCIDPGHQRVGSSVPEPIGPGASETKMRVTGGTQGRFTGVTEYDLNLAVGLLLRDELTARGYTVVMTRETNDVDLSNSERAAIAKDAGADVFVRIHANGSDDPAAHGAMTICMTPQNPYNAALYEKSRALSDCVLDGMVAATGCARERVWETDTMSGVNWAAMPVTIVEMGYMTNETEDRLLATDDYRARMAQGIADGVDAYFARTESGAAP